jgi:hypothetical protein
MAPDQTAQMRRLVFINAGRKCTWRGSNGMDITADFGLYLSHGYI